MKFVYSLILLSGLLITADAQTATISKGEFDGTLNHASTASSSALPLVLTTTRATYRDGKLLFNLSEVHERQSLGVERIARSFTRGGKTGRQYQITLNAENIYCSEDGAKWTGPWPYECATPSMADPSIEAMRIDPKSIEYSVTTRSTGDERVKDYREYIVYMLTTPKSKARFKETVSTVDSRGLVIEIVTSEGITEPHSVTSVRKEKWVPNAKFAPVVAPVK